MLETTGNRLGQQSRLANGAPHLNEQVVRATLDRCDGIDRSVLRREGCGNGALFE